MNRRALASILAAGLSASVLAQPAPAKKPAAGPAPETAPSKKPAPAKKSALPFIEDDYPRALAEARSKKLPIFVEAWAPW